MGDLKSNKPDTSSKVSKRSEINNIATQFTDSIICPECKYDFGIEASYELIESMGNGDHSEIDCNQCETCFEYYLNVSVTFSTNLKKIVKGE